MLSRADWTVLFVCASVHKRSVHVFAAVFTTQSRAHQSVLPQVKHKDMQNKAKEEQAQALRKLGLPSRTKAGVAQG
jgi:hypothetical protein